MCIDTIIDIKIDIDNFNTDASTANAVHACLYTSFSGGEFQI